MAIKEDYPVFAKGTSRRGHFQIHFKEIPRKLKLGDRLVIVHYHNSSKTIYYFKVLGKSPYREEFNRAQYIADGEKVILPHLTDIKLEEGVLYTSLPNIREISVFKSQKVSIQLSFSDYWREENFKNQQRQKYKKLQVLKAEALEKEIQEDYSKQKKWRDVNEEVLYFIYERKELEDDLTLEYEDIGFKYSKQIPKSHSLWGDRILAFCINRGIAIRDWRAVLKEFDKKNTHRRVVKGSYRFAPSGEISKTIKSYLEDGILQMVSFEDMDDWGIPSK